MIIDIGFLKTKIKAIEPKIIWFLLVGAFNTLLGFGLFPIIYWTLVPYRSHYILMLIGCHITTVLNAYVTNKYLVFRTQGFSSSEIGKFILFHIIYFLVMITLVPILVQFASINPVVIQFGISVFVVICSFFWYDKMVFLSKNKQNRFRDK